MTHRMLLVGIALASCAPSFAAATDPGAPQSFLITDARIWTADAAKPSATALVVRDGKFLFIGDDAGARAAASNIANIHIIEAQGKRILPGLIDSHVHLGNGAADLLRLNLRDATSREDLLARLSAHAKTLPRGAWVEGSRWSSESWPDQRPPNADEIDGATEGRPAVLTRMDGHMLLAGRAALRIAGITREGPPDPPGGKIGRDGDRQPDGAIYEEAMALVTSRISASGAGGGGAWSASTDPQALQRACAELSAMGLTTVGAIDTRETIEALAALDRAGGLHLRVVATVWNDEAPNVERWRPTLEWAAAHRDLSPNVRVVGFKAYMDGSLGSRTGWQSAPYLDDPHDPGNAGMPLAMAGAGTLRDLIALGAAMGLQPAVHAIGDRANHALLDWFEQALTPEQRRTLRPRIEHAQHLLPADIARFGALGVVPSMQPYHKADDGRYAAQRLGDARCKTSYAFRGLLDSKAPLAFGSDWPVVSCSPFRGVAAAVNCLTLDGKVFVPEQAISVEESLRAYTTGAAWALHAEQSAGMIKVGRPADFVMLADDVLAVSPERLGEVRVEMTVVGGEVVLHVQQ